MRLHPHLMTPSHATRSGAVTVARLGTEARIVRRLVAPLALAAFVASSVAFGASSRTLAAESCWSKQIIRALRAAMARSCSFAGLVRVVQGAQDAPLRRLSRSLLAAHGQDGIRPRRPE